MLARLRQRRGFNAPVCRDAKALLLNRYARRHGLRAAVVGVSGGVDSAVTLALVRYAAQQPGSPFERVVGVLAPMFDTAGATGQDAATARGREVIAACGADEVTLDLSHPLESMLDATHRAVGYSGQAWATGQLVSYLRTPAFYHVATLLTEQGFPAVVIGTTNRDEGAYIGFFGKASDGMVDIQLISDLHKSEVYALADLLDVPESVRRATPTGDTFDGRTDEQMIGVPYDGIELAALDTTGHPLDGMRAVLDERHRRNAHKYLGASPAVHLDVYERGVPGGWPLQRYVEPAAPPSHVTLPTLSDAAHVSRNEPIADFGGSAFLIRGLLSNAECAQLRSAFDAVPATAVGRDGYAGTDGHGSRRAPAYDPEFAVALWERMRPLLPAIRITDAHTPTDTNDTPVWRAVGLNPYLRLMKYEPGSELVRHYDSTFDFGDGRRTLMSVVVYLSDGGAPTRLLLEPQRHLSVGERDFSDASSIASATDVLAAVTPVAGDALVLDHRVPHDVPPSEGERLVMRTDVVYVCCGADENIEAPARTEIPWDVARDSYYHDAFQTLGSMEAIEHAGYFDDGRPEGYEDPRFDSRWMTTPLDAITRRLASAPADKPLVVALSTGGFYPVHRGHTAMMDIARSALEDRGWHVLGGYLSPGHDHYVGSKAADAPDAERRLRLCEDATADSDWLMVDPWEALHTGRAVNFTEVVARLEAYLSRHIRTHRRIHVAYVFGGDNARFATAFTGRGLAVCVPRLGFEAQVAEAFAHPLVRSNPRVILAGENAPPAASRTVRSGDATHLTERMRDAWATRESAKEGKLLVRDEGDWPVQMWLGRFPTAHEAMRDFRRGITAALTRAFADHRVTIESVPVAEQRSDDISGTVLSLDPCVPGHVSLGVSRAFAIASACRESNIVARPGWPSLAAQLEAIPAGVYTLLDDDSSTGATLRAVQSMLPPDRRIERVATFSSARDGVLDLIDGRDFLAGSRDAGLVVALPTGELARVPYTLPYVRLTDRCSVPPGRAMELTRAVWELNRLFFTRVPVCIGDTAAPFRTFCRYLGFPETMSMLELSDWHLTRSGG